MKLTKDQFIQKVIDSAKSIDVILEIEKAEKLYEYKEMLIEWNSKINLTAITDDEEIIEKHIIDSLELTKYLKQGKTLIDVGTGAGLPGVILAIFFNGEIKITLFDALNKRIIFLQEVINRLKLKNTEAIHGRAEETSRDVTYREQYDYVVSRAVAQLNVLLELTAPFVKVRGNCIYMKADKAQEEILEASKAINILNVKHISTNGYVLNTNKEENITRNIILFEKIKDIPEKYPRMFSKIKKSPL